MKKLLILLSFFLALSVLSAQDRKSFLLFDSNIFYAPIGIKFFNANSEVDKGWFVTVKLSEDYFSRNINSFDAYPYREGDIFDINETILAAGSTHKFNENISFYYGVGAMAGKKYFPYKTEWVRSTSWSVMPLLTFGIILSKDDFMISLGNEISFASDNMYPVYVANKKSLARLSSFTIGFGYLFEP